MEDYKSRLAQERKELDEKIEKLESFINSQEFYKVSPEEKDLLIEQHDTMTDYSVILGKRIAINT